MKQLVIIAGPTAIGKTALAIEMARRLGTEIVSCDSRQVYRELNIGVARPSTEELAAVRHHFIACRSILEPYNAWQYGEDAREVVTTLLAHHDTVIAVGGSGLYIDALCHGISHMPDPTPELRQALSQQIADGGLPELLQRLEREDPEYYAVVDRNNPIRIQRAMEVIITSGKPYSQLLKASTTPLDLPYRIVKVALRAERPWLRNRIDRRVEMMMEHGLLEEVESLLPHRALNTLNTVGYKELFKYIDGRCSLEEALTEIRNHTWQYAKKQLTWLNRYTDIAWLDAEKEDIADSLVKIIA